MRQEYIHCTWGVCKWILILLCFFSFSIQISHLNSHVLLCYYLNIKKHSEEAKQTASYKEGKAKVGDNKKAANKEIADAESEAYEEAEEELFTSFGINSSDGKLTKDGVGRCDIEVKAIRIAITLSHNGGLPSSLDGWDLWMSPSIIIFICSLVIIFIYLLRI